MMYHCLDRKSRLGNTKVSRFALRLRDRDGGSNAGFYTLRSYFESDFVRWIREKCDRFDLHERRSNDANRAINNTNLCTLQFTILFVQSMFSSRIQCAGGQKMEKP
jgi:hypothetical protein